MARPHLRGDTGKCLHYYFYFIDEELGLCYLRVPTWAPFGLQFYCNGHSALAQSLKREGIGFAQADNAFVRIDDLARAQALADALSPDVLHRRLDIYAQWLCPVLDVFGQSYHWSIRQIEYSTDLMFKSAGILSPLYDCLSRQAVLAADAPRVAGRRNQAGFTYIGLLIAVVFFGLASVGAARLLASTERTERETELLFIGHQFRQAIRSYLPSGP